MESNFQDKKITILLSYYNIVYGIHASTLFLNFINLINSLIFKPIRSTVKLAGELNILFFTDTAPTRMHETMLHRHCIHQDARDYVTQTVHPPGCTRLC